YRAAGKGGIENPASVLINPNPAIVMNTVSPVTIRKGQVCGYLRKADIETAHFTVNGAEADSATSASLRQRVTVLFAPMLDHEICTAYIPKQGGAKDELIAKATVDGAPMPGPEQIVIWVSPSDGYKVAP